MESNGAHISGREMVTLRRVVELWYMQNYPMIHLVGLASLHFCDTKQVSQSTSTHCHSDCTSSSSTKRAIHRPVHVELVVFGTEGGHIQVRGPLQRGGLVCTLALDGDGKALRAGDPVLHAQHLHVRLLGGNLALHLQPLTHTYTHTYMCTQWDTR